MISNICLVHLIVSCFRGGVATIPTVTLNNGVEMPLLSLGTAAAGMYQNDTAAEVITRMSLQVGFTGVDTAVDYENQEGIGRALAEVDRSSVFLTTKIDGRFNVLRVYNDTLDEAQQNLNLLNLDYVDLVLIHFPARYFLPANISCTFMQEQWRGLEDFMRFGKARAIGVSNFCRSDLACILETATIVPAVNQLSLHVGMGPDPLGLVSHNDELGIKTMAYEVLGSRDYSQPDEPKDNSLIVGNFTNGIGEQYGKTGSQVALRWLVQHGIPFATASSKEKHLREDVDVFSFALDDTDMQKLDDATTPTGQPNNWHPGIPPCEAVEWTFAV